MLSPEIQETLNKTLLGLTASDNELRSFAERQLQQEFVKSRPRDLLLGLTHFLKTHRDASVPVYAILIKFSFEVSVLFCLGVSDLKLLFLIMKNLCFGILLTLFPRIQFEGIY
jgi:hypothetical protein